MPLQALLQVFFLWAFFFPGVHPFHRTIPSRQRSCLAFRLSFRRPLLLGSLIPPLVSTSHLVSLDSISSSSATKLPFDVWSCFIEIFGHVFPPRPIFRSRVSVVLDSVDYLHLSSFPQLLIFNLYFPSSFFFQDEHLWAMGFFFNRVICLMPADFTFARVQCLVHRLHYLVQGRVNLQGLNRSSPFQASEPLRLCTPSTSTSLYPGRTCLAIVFVYKGK